MSKLLELREAFNELIESLRKKRDSINSSNGVSIRGPSSVNQGETVTWEISNFDIASSYQVRSDLGTATINEKTITFKHEIGELVHSPFDLTIVCNGTKRIVKVPIQEVGILPPYLQTIVAGFSNNKYTFTFSMSPFNVYPAGSAIHTATDWEIASDPSFSTILWSSLNNSTNKTTVTTGGFDASLTLYLRVRYRGSKYIPSRWYTSPIRTNNQVLTSYSTNFSTSYSAGTLRNTTHVTSWITSKNTMDYSVSERTTSQSTAYKDWNGTEWVDKARVTAWTTSTIESKLMDTTWNTSINTSYQTAAGYEQQTSHVTSYKTLFDRVTGRSTSKNWTTTFSTSKSTSGSLNTQANTSWTTFTWGAWKSFTQGTDSLAYTDLNKYLWNWRNINYPGDQIEYLGKNSDGTQLYFRRRHRENIATTSATTVKTTLGSYDTVWSASRLTSGLANTNWNTSVERETSHETIYNTVYGFDTSQITSWGTQHVTTARTDWNTSHGTIHVTAWNSVQSWQTQVPYTANPSVSSPKFGTNIDMGYSFYLGGQIWSIGYGSGLDNANGNMRLEYHDGTRITILPSEGAVPNPHNAAAVWYYNQKIYIFGGALPNGGLSGNLHMYSLSSNSWVLMSSTPGKCSSLLFSKVGSVFFIFGGVGEGEQYMWRYHTTSDTWVKMDPIPSWGSSTLSNGSGYECAEYGNGFYYYRHHDNTLWYFSYSANSGSWSKIMDLPSPQENLMTRNSAIGIVNGRLYLLYTHLDVFKSTVSFLIYRLDTGTRTYTKVADIKAADTTGGARTERVMFDGSSFHVIYPGTDSSYMTDVKYSISGFDAPSGTQNVYTSVSVPMSRTTSYDTVYSTGQNTSWTTNYDTSQNTTWITGIRMTSKVTSNNTSNLTDV